jgi:ribosomal protein S12 methylthiotransferase accessory factor
LVHIPYAGKSPDECLGYCTSTGLACAKSEVGACLAGLLEVCERDAFAIMWLNRLSMPRLHPEAKSPIGQLLRDLRCKQNDRVTFINLTNDFGAFTVAAVLQRQFNGSPLLTVGAASHWSPNRAAEKALFEAISQDYRIREVVSQSGERWQPAPDYSNVTDFPFHSLLYADPREQPHLDFMTASNVVEPLADAGPQASEETRLRHLVANVARTGADVIAVPLTTRDVAELGLHVVKMVVPEAVPLNPDHRYPWLGSPRLYRLPRLLGYRNRNTLPEELNLAIPHPFA